MNRNSESHFAQVPRMERPRSKFDRGHQLLTTINEGELVPIYMDEVISYPSLSKYSQVCRMA